MLKIDNALSQMGETGRKATVERLEVLFRDSDGFSSALENKEGDDEDEDEAVRPLDWVQASDSEAIVRIDSGEEFAPKPNQIIARAKSVRNSVSGDDAEDIDRLIGLIENARQMGDQEMLDGLEAELEDLLFYLT